MGSRSRNEDAMDQYFNEFVPMLEEHVKDELGDEDPTIDLENPNCLQVARTVPQKAKPRPSKGHSTNRTYEMAVRDVSCSLDGLRDITEHLKRGSKYGDKLIKIMLDGLEKSMSAEFFRVIVDRGVPPTWLPIVKRNNEDTPYIEFLVKNDKSDEEPFSQISDYSLEHLALSKYVLDHMLKSTPRRTPPPKQRSSLPAMTRRNVTSTPIRERQAPQDSTRVLPHRACKPSGGSFSKYLA